MSTNAQRSKPRTEEDGNNRTDEEHGPSAQFQRRPVPSTSAAQHHSSISSEDSQNSPEAAPGGSIKARNVSRTRPTPETTRERKRARLSDDNEEMDESLREEVHMDTDSSEKEEDELIEEDNVDENEVVDLSRNVDFDSLPVQDLHETGHSRRSSSTAEENVSTTMETSHHHRRPQSYSRMDPVIASTSSATPRILEPGHNGSGDPDAPVAGPSRRRSIVRESTPVASVSRSNLDNRFQVGARQVDENRSGGGVDPLDKLQGKQRLMWARKLFFLSTELVFPGFMNYSDNKIRMPDYMGVRVRSSCLMQALLYADLLFFIAWTFSFLSTFDILITVLKELHGYLSLCLTTLFILVNIPRLRFGLKGNENDEVQYLALFWMTTVIVQIPLFTFIFLTDLFCPVLLAFTVTMDGVMMCFILVESVVGFLHFRSLLRDELNVIKMARRSKETQSSAAAGEPAHSGNIIDLSRNIPAVNEDESESENDGVSYRGHDNPAFQRERMDFQMSIRRLSESQRGPARLDIGRREEDSDSNSSEQVTSTSDAHVRRRTVIAH